MKGIKQMFLLTVISASSVASAVNAMENKQELVLLK